AAPHHRGLASARDVPSRGGPVAPVARRRSSAAAPRPAARARSRSARAWRTKSAGSSLRPPPAQRAAGLQVANLLFEQILLGRRLGSLRGPSLVWFLCGHSPFSSLQWAVQSIREAGDGGPSFRLSHDSTVSAQAMLGDVTRPTRQAAGDQQAVFLSRPTVTHV